MVIGPTPPGTGVIWEAFGATSSNFTSPTNLNPLFLDGSEILWIPTSITTAPSLTISAVTKPGLPKATIKISAVCAISDKFWVLLWVKVTVQLPGLPFLAIKILMGDPTIWLLPITTQCLPEVSIWYLFKSSKMPYGVADT